MAKVNYQQIYKVDHTKFGGLITGFDFDGHPTMKIWQIEFQVTGDLTITVDIQKKI